MKKHGSLEIEDDIAHHRRFWLYKRIGWAVMFLLVALAIAGYTGGGFSSERNITDGSLSVQYQRFARRSALSPFRVVTPNIGKDTVRIHFSSDYMQDMMIEQMVPLPVTTIAGESSVTYCFLADATEPRSEIIFFLRPDKHGAFAFNLSTAGGSVSLKQLIFP